MKGKRRNNKKKKVFVWIAIIFLLLCMLTLNLFVKALTLDEVIQQSPAFHLIEDIYVLINNQYHQLSEWISFEADRLKINKELDLQGNKITGLAAPSDPKDAVNLETLEQALGSGSGGQQISNCPLFAGTFFFNGGNPYFCRKMSVSTEGYVSYTNINEDRKCDEGKTCCQGECDTDQDMDGYSLNCDGDCDDNNVNIGIATDGTCDGDLDGHIDFTAGGDDCDDNDPNAWKVVSYYCDKDGDGHISKTPSGKICENENVPEGCQLSPGDDCDDSCSSCYPGSTAYTYCPDGKDQDCDSSVDEVIGTVSLGVHRIYSGSCKDYCESLGSCAYCFEGAEGAIVYPWYRGCIELYSQNNCQGTKIASCLNYHTTVLCEESIEGCWDRHAFAYQYCSGAGSTIIESVKSVPGSNCGAVNYIECLCKRKKYA